MSAPTGDPALIRTLNDFLGQELGRNQYGKPYFTWRWSEDLFWPAARTGNLIQVPHEAEIPLIGGGVEKATLVDVVPEYARERQLRRSNVWVVCKWLTPWELITGPLRGSWKHGDQMQMPDGSLPTHERQVEMWNSLFPGAEFPARGWRIPTDAYLPSNPHDPNYGRTAGHEPNWADTKHFVMRVKAQTSESFDTVLNDMMAKLKERDEGVPGAMMDEIRDGFNAFLNPNPGKRGGFISFPWSKKDRVN